VTRYLRPAIKYGAVDLWLDRPMPRGAEWEREIEQKLRSCDIFILLVSRHSLSSDYMIEKKIAILRERQAGRGRPFLSACAYADSEGRARPGAG
jgi:TIR domain